MSSLCVPTTTLTEPEEARGKNTDLPTKPPPPARNVAGQRRSVVDGSVFGQRRSRNQRPTGKTAPQFSPAGKLPVAAPETSIPSTRLSTLLGSRCMGFFLACMVLAQHVLMVAAKTGMLAPFLDSVGGSFLDEDEEWDEPSGGTSLIFEFWESKPKNQCRGICGHGMGVVQCRRNIV